MAASTSTTTEPDSESESIVMVDTEEDSLSDNSILSTATSDSAGPSTGSSTVTSMLQRLRCPKSSELARKRKIDRNPPPFGKRRSRGQGKHDPKSVSPNQRVQQFPNEHLRVSNKRLFCTACREEISMKSSIIQSHIKSSKHQTGKKRLEGKDKDEREIADFLKSDDESNHPKGETLPLEQRVYRIKVVNVFLRSGVPLSKIQEFRSILEENGLRLSDRRHMADMIPLVLNKEKMRIKEEISGKSVSVIFDGTSRLGEALAIIIRFVDSSWSIQQRLIRFHLLAKSLSGEEIAREMIATLSVQYSVLPDFLVAAMRDCASSNNVAMRTIKIVYPLLLDIGCFAHTIDRVGEKFNTPNLNEFTTYWVNLFSHSHKARLLWKERTGQSYCGYSPTRWWSKWEVQNQLLELFGDLELFLNSEEEFSAATKAKLLGFFTDPVKKGLLQIELSAVVDAGMPFVQTTYKLESDNPIIALECYELISSLTSTVDMAHYPNVQAVTRQISVSGANEDAKERLVNYAHSCIKPAIDYYNAHLKAPLMSAPLNAFKAARLFSPTKVKMIKPDIAMIETLSTFPFVNDTTLSALKSEFPNYVAATEDVSSDLSPLEFWKAHADKLPSWSETAKKVLLLQPSSAAAERAFSVLKSTFNEQQLSSLEDYIEASMMLQYNKQ